MLSSTLNQTTYFRHRLRKILILFYEFMLRYCVLFKAKFRRVVLTSTISIKSLLTSHHAIDRRRCPDGSILIPRAQRGCRGTVETTDGIVYIRIPRIHCKMNLK